MDCKSFGLIHINIVSSHLHVACLYHDEIINVAQLSWSLMDGNGHLSALQIHQSHLTYLSQHVLNYCIALKYPTLLEGGIIIGVYLHFHSTKMNDYLPVFLHKIKWRCYTEYCSKLWVTPSPFLPWDNLCSHLSTIFISFHFREPTSHLQDQLLGFLPSMHLPWYVGKVT